MAPDVHLEWTPARWENMPQGPSCRLAHRAGVISCEAPLLVFSGGGKVVVGGANKEGQSNGFHSHQGRPWQFSGLSSLPVHPYALLAVAILFSSSVMLSSVMTMSLRPLLSSHESHQYEVISRPAFLVWVAPMTSLIRRRVLLLAPL